MNLDQHLPPKGTVRDWLDARARTGGTGFVFPAQSEELTWRELRAAAASIASDLTQRGCAKGESVAIMQPNGADAVIALFACLYGGFRATLINLAAGPQAIAYALDHCGARHAFVHSSVRDVFDKVKPMRLSTVTRPVEAAFGTLHGIEAQDHALLMYTSGTTGKPKGVVHSHASLLAGGWTTAVAHALTSQDRGFCVLPIYHINGLCVTVMGSLVSGGSLAMVPKFSASAFWRHLAAGKATWFSVVPTIISHLLHSKEQPCGETRQRIRFGRSASSALAPEVQKSFEERFGIPIIETMGLTETAAQILSNPLPPGIRKIGSPGIAFGNEVAIFNDKLEPCAPGTEGEIAVRGPNVMLEYLDNAEATASCFHNDWFRTGDLGRMDQDGFVFVTGRLKELIIKGGENIAPREIDEALYSHPDVVEAAAFAKPDPDYGERIEAAVRLCPGSSLGLDELKELCRAKLGSFKTPDHIYLLHELPKGPSGKIQRLKLAEITAS